MSLNTATPEHQPVDQIETYAFRPGWDRDMAQRFGHVGHRLPPRFDGPPVPGRAGLCTAWDRSCR